LAQKEALVFPTNEPLLIDPASGHLFIKQFFDDDNQLVKAGQSIAKLDPRDYVVQLQQTEASLQQARAQLKQSDAQLNQAQAQLQQAKAQAEAGDPV
jgi:membrane fusion protein (multidrug efflux system)